MGISAECNECGATLDVSFSVDCDGDGSATVERCDCQDDRMRTDAVDNFMEDGFWDALNTIISEDASQFIEDNADLSECVQNTIDEAIEEKTEELAKEVISNIVGKYTMVPKGEPTVSKSGDGLYTVNFDCSPTAPVSLIASFTEE